ncbi:uncharacterized protein DEA37_0011597, partial [Paragonimus westermani]
FGLYKKTFHLQVLQKGTHMLALNSAARRIFLPSGEEIYSLKQINNIHHMFISCGESFKDPRKQLEVPTFNSVTDRENKTPKQLGGNGQQRYLGPVWVSKGEGYSPSGVYDYLGHCIGAMREKLEPLRTYKKQLEAAKEGNRNEIKQMKILSMSSSEQTEELELLLEQISASAVKVKPNGPAGGIAIKRLFTESGQEVFELKQLSDGDIVIISYGEGWITPKVRELTNRSVHCRLIHPCPKEHVELFALPLLITTTKQAEHESTKPAGSQIWSINKQGQIRPRPCLGGLTLGLIPKADQVFGLADRNFQTPNKPNNKKLSGLRVALVPQNDDDVYQHWRFGVDGFIHNQGDEDLVLTCLHRSKTSNKEDNLRSVERNTAAHIAACTVLSRSWDSCQRWAIKQERWSTFGQWRHSQVPNPEWHRKAFTWPVDRQGEINDSLIWPVEGLLKPFVPPLEPSRGHAGSHSAIVGVYESACFKLQTCCDPYSRIDPYTNAYVYPIRLQQQPSREYFQRFEFTVDGVLYPQADPTLALTMITSVYDKPRLLLKKRRSGEASQKFRITKEG